MDFNKEETIVKRCFKERPREELPRERLETLGPEALSDAELLAILLRTGTRQKSVLELAEEVLHLNPQYDGLVGLTHFCAEDFQVISGIGKAKAVELSAVGEISRRIWRRNVRCNIKSFLRAKDVMNFYKEDLRFLSYEAIHVLFLDNQMQLIREMRISQGTCNQTAISPRDIFMEALRCRAVCLILVHNHPSGVPEPSQADMDVTQDIKKAGECLGIHLVDHIIIGDNRYHSFKEQGLI